MKTFCIGDIHGAYLALMQCLDLSGFDYAKDRLIVLGDVCDGYPQVHLCIDELLKITHCDYILGNHDVWALAWALKDEKPEFWITQGGRGTMDSYDHKSMPKAHVDFLNKARLWLKVDNKVFVHGGFNAELPLEDQGVEGFVWDRELIYGAWKKSQEDPGYRFGSFDEIFLGHTPVQNFQKSALPQQFCNVWDLDTGAGWSGPLTIMNIETKEYWQSAPTPELYPGIKSRHV